MRSSDSLLTVLVVDDDLSLRPALARSLEKDGLRVLTASDGKEALKKLAEEKIDLLVSDIMMPEMNGIELTRSIRESHSDLPIILMTGFAHILETEQAFKAGANEFFAKPFDREDLRAAVKRCLSRESTNADSARAAASSDEAFCKISIEDFVSGKLISHSIFVRLAPNKYVKIAHEGQDLSMERVRAYRSKGLRFLYLRREDFTKYIGFNLSLTKAVESAKNISKEKKLNLLRHTGELLLEKIQHDGVDREVFDSSVTFVQSTVAVLYDDQDVFTLMQTLNSHSDHLYAHSVGVSLYSVMIARAIKWTLPTNLFKIATGGLLHDIGEKEFGQDILRKPRHSWNMDEVKMYETHPHRAAEILREIESVPNDVTQIVRDHHEDIRGLGFPARVRRSQIHPMAKLIAVADEFCNRIIHRPSQKLVEPNEALSQMVIFCGDKLEPQFFMALMGLFKFEPPAEIKRRGFASDV